MEALTIWDTDHTEKHGLANVLHGRRASYVEELVEGLIRASPLQDVR
jgi:hypothetical protein